MHTQMLLSPHEHLQGLHAHTCADIHTCTQTQPSPPVRWVRVTVGTQTQPSRPVPGSVVVGMTAMSVAHFMLILQFWDAYGSPTAGMDAVVLIACRPVEETTDSKPHECAAQGPRDTRGERALQTAGHGFLIFTQRQAYLAAASCVSFLKFSPGAPATWHRHELLLGAPGVLCLV